MNDQITLDLNRQHAAAGRCISPREARISIQLGRLVGRAVGIVFFATLVVLEPFVRFILMTLATLGTFVTIVFGFLIGAEGFPQWFMLAMSVGCFLLLGAYYGILRIVGNVTTERDLS